MRLEVPEPLEAIHRYIESRKAKYFADLKEAVEIQSVSSAPNRRDDVVRMIEWTEKYLNDIGGLTERCEVGYEHLTKDRKLLLPPVLLAYFGKDPRKKTLLVYGHMDVYNANIEDGWIAEPFTVTEKDGMLYGRGVADNKGPLLCWFNAIEAYKVMNVELPVNIKFIIEGMHEMRSQGIKRLFYHQKNFFLHVDVVCISDGYWLTTKTPCIIYGTRGLASFSLEVKGLSHAGYGDLYSGAMREPLADLLFLLNSLQGPQGQLTIPGLNDKVIKVTPTEEALFDRTEVQMEELRNKIGVSRLAFDEHKGKVLQHMWRFPHLTFHGIEGMEGCGIVDSAIPMEVTAKFSIRFVHYQTPWRVQSIVTNYLKHLWDICNSTNQMHVEMTFEVQPWLDDPFTPYYGAARDAIKTVYSMEPNIIRMGGSMPIIHPLRQMNEGKNIIIIPLSNYEDNAHRPNERIISKRYYRYVKVFASFFYMVAKL